MKTFVIVARRNLCDRLMTATRSRGLRSIVWSLLAELLKLASQTALFIIVAKRLGVSEYGIFAAVTATVAVVGCISNLGSGHVLMRAIARGEDPSEAFAAGLTTTVMGGVLGVGVACLAGHLLLPQAALPVLLLLSAADLLGTATVDLCSQCLFAQGKAKAAARIRLCMATVRIIAAGLLLARGASAHALSYWALLYASAMALASLLALFITQAQAEIHIAVRWLSFRRFFAGVPFSMNLSAAYIQDDIDKTMMLRYAGSQIAGFYAAGYRALNFAYVPLQAALNILYPQFFKAGQQGAESAARLVKKILLPAFLYGAVCCAGLCLVSPIIPEILGSGFRNAQNVLVWVSWLPLVRAFEYCFADFLTGTGNQTKRIYCQATGAAVNIAANVILIPAFTWRGAAISTAVSECLTLLLLVACFRTVLKQSRQNAATSAEPAAADVSVPHVSTNVEDASPLLLSNGVTS